MHLVIIEWDGKAPPTAYYHRLDKLGLRVRAGKLAEKGIAPIARRLKEDGHGGVIMQEGCLLTPSESQARAVARLAERYGAKAIFIAPQVQLEGYEASERDLWAVQRIDSVFGRRGKPPEAKHLAVCCHEELASYDIEAVDVAACPGCGGLDLHTIEGETPRFYSGSAAADLWLYWFNTRFATGSYFAPVDSISPNQPAPPKNTQLKDPAEMKLVERMSGSPFITKLVGDEFGLPVTTVLLILDSIFVTRSWGQPSTRKTARIVGITRYFELDGDPSLVNMNEPKNRVDPFDAQHIPPAELATMLIAHPAMLEG